MDEIEEVSRCLPNFALAVVKGSKMDLNMVEKDKAAVKLHSEWEIILIEVIVAASGDSGNYAPTIWIERQEKSVKK